MKAIATETAVPGVACWSSAGAPVGLEIGQVMARFGAKVTVVEMGDRMSPGAEEPEASALITDILRREGITVHVGASTSRASPNRRRVDGARCTVHLDDGSSVTAESGYWWQPAAALTWLRSGVAALGLDDTRRRAAGRRRGCGSSRECGASAM